MQTTDLESVLVSGGSRTKTPWAAWCKQAVCLTALSSCMPMTEMQAEEVCGGACLSQMASSCRGLMWRRCGELSLPLVRRIQFSSLPGVPLSQLHLLILSDGGSGRGWQVFGPCQCNDDMSVWVPQLQQGYLVVGVTMHLAGRCVW